MPYINKAVAGGAVVTTPIVSAVGLTTAGDYVEIIIQPQSPGGPDNVGRFSPSGTYGSAVVAVQKVTTQSEEAAASWLALTGVVRADTYTIVNGNLTLADNSSLDLNMPTVAGFYAVRLTLVSIGSGTLNVDGSTFPLPAPSVTPIAITVASTNQTITSTSANALAVGANGVTNPAFNVDASTGSSATGVTVKSAAAAAGVAIQVTSSGANEALKIDAKAAALITLAGAAASATGVQVGSATSAANAVLTVNSSNAAALTVGANGATNPVLKVNANTASAATGWSLTGAAAAAGAALAVISSGTNEAGTIDGKGSGAVKIGSVSTGGVQLGAGVVGGPAVVVPGTLTAGGLLTAAIQVATSGPLIYSGSGAPTISAAVKGSIYLRTDGSSGSTRMYVASDTAGTWTNVTTAA